MDKISKSLDSFFLSATMSQLQGKQCVTVTIEALHLWHRQQIEAQLQRFYTNRNSHSLQEEEEWAQATQEQAIASWEHKGS